MNKKDSKIRMCVLGAATSPHVLMRTEVFQDLGYQVSLISPVPYVGEKRGFEIVWPSQTQAPKGVRGILNMIKLLKIVRRKSADVFFAHYASEITSFAAMLTLKRLLVVNVMGGDVLDDQNKNKNLFKKMLTILVLRRADLITVKSTQLRDVVLKIGVLPSKVMQIYWGVDSKIFHNTPSDAKVVRAAWGVKGNDYVLFSPRILQPIYNQKTMISAMPGILKNIPQAVLVISMFGASQEYLLQLRDEVRALEIQDKVIFVEGIDNSKMPGAYSASDVVLSLPSSDGFPQTIFEAMSCQVPVIASNLSHYRDLISDRKHALVVEISTKQIIDSICLLYLDRELREQLISNGKSMVAKSADLLSQASQVSSRLKLMIQKA